MPLFLFNFETKELHGIFKAASDGDWEIDPYGGQQYDLPYSLPVFSLSFIKGRLQN